MNSFRKLNFFYNTNEKLILKIFIFLAFLLILNKTFNDNHARLFVNKKNFKFKKLYDVSELHRPESNLSYVNDSGKQDWLNIKHELERMAKTSTSKPKIKHCDSIPPNLVGRISVRTPPSEFNATLTYSYNFTNGLHNGGKWKPKNCVARHRVAIIIPYKDRADNLNSFLFNMHMFLQKQELEYQIFVVEQINDDLFNKGILMNSCFLEIYKAYYGSNVTIKYLDDYPFDCVIFHDVDLLPEDDRIMYSCPKHKPRHLSVAIDKYNYKMFYFKLVGGVLNLRTSHFVRVNGYSNEYWGWGAEDDDMEARLTATHLGYERPNIKIAHYKMLKHKSRVKNPKRVQLLVKATKRYLTDGLNSVKYKLIKAEKFNMYTHFWIDVGKPPEEVVNAIKAADRPKLNAKVSVQVNNATNNSSISRRNAT